MRKGILAIVLLLCCAAFARAADGPVFFPTPQKMSLQGQTTVKKVFMVKALNTVPWATVNEYETRLREWGLDMGEGGLTVELTMLPMADCEKIVVPPYQKKSMLDYPELQAYFLTVGDAAVSVKACAEDGFFYALMTLRNLVAGDAGDELTLYKADITDFPVFPVRGLFEGAYGIWDLEGRLKVLDWMGGVKLNSFIYGPKGDTKMRRSWRALYTELELFDFKRMLAVAKKNHIQFGYVIAPPSAMEYGSDADFEVLLRKVRQLQSLGVKYFVIGFDDTMGMMYYENDRKRFANLGEAEAFLCNRMYDALVEYDPEVIVVIVPEIYGGVHPMDYTNSLVEKLNPEIYIGWTGPEIGSPHINAADMQKFIDFYGRMPSLGDNWGSLFPLLARSPDIYKFSTQFTVNPYNLFGEIPIPGLGGASEPAMALIEMASPVEFAWNPAAHDPDDIVNRLAEIHYEPEGRDVFKFLIYKDYYHYRAYYTLDTDYMPPLETGWVSAMEAGDGDAIKQLAAKTRTMLEDIKTKLDLAETACRNPEIGHGMAVRAGVAPEYIDAMLKALDGVQSAGDSAVAKSAAGAFLKALRGDES